MEHLAPIRRSSDSAQEAPEFRLIRRKRPRTPEPHADAYPPFPEKAARMTVLPGLAELLAAQKQRHEGVAADALLDVLSRVSTAEQEKQQQLIEEEIEVEDKTPWPSAKQYHDIFSTPKSELKLPVYDLGVDPRGVPLHPEFIYSQPVSCMYFLRCSRLLGKGSFGFPRKKKQAGDATPTTTPTAAGKKPAGKGGKKESSKDFEWRKMSFVTGLPKKQPIVRYITATCYSRATDVAAKKKVFRMHAVMLADESGTGEKGEYVLVHIRAGGSKRVGLRASLTNAEAQQAPASPGARGTANAKQNADLLCMRRPLSPTSVAVSSYSSTAASTSPTNKKLLHAEFVASQAEGSDHFAKALTESMAPMEVDATPSVTRHPLFTAAEDPKVDSARLALRNMILKSCTSRDEMAKYVMGLQEELAALQNQHDMSTSCAFSIAQCVAKRTRQLERLLYMIESTATKFQQAKSPYAGTNSNALFSSSARAQVQKRYGKLLLDFLEKERSLQMPALFADAMHLESYDEELQQLLVLVEDEELLRQRVGETWAFLATTSIDQEDIVPVVRACEFVWDELLPQTSYATPMINSIRGDPDAPSWMRSSEADCSPIHPWPSTIQRTQ